MARFNLRRLDALLKGKFGTFLLVVASVTFIYLVGYFSRNHVDFPSKIKRDIYKLYHEAKSYLVFYDEKTENAVTSYNEKEAFKGLNLSFECSFNREIRAYLRTMDGEIVNQWDLSHEKIWPKENHLPDEFKFEGVGSVPFPHGAVMCSNGDIILNIEYRGLLRIDKSGNVVWRLPYCTHHSVTFNCDSSAIWVCGMEIHNERKKEIHGNYDDLFRDYTFLKVSLDGEVLEKLYMNQMFRDSDMWGMIYSSGKGELYADYTHLNDVECYCDSTGSSVLEQGDLIFSLCHLSDIYIYDISEKHISHSICDLTVYQHDPDFIGGDVISVFDNFKIGRDNNEKLGGSRILKIDIQTKKVKTVFQGSEEQPFYTGWGGKHQWLPNGNLLVTEAARGRAFELNAENEIVWEYKHPKFSRGWILDVQRVPMSMLTNFQ